MKVLAATHGDCPDVVALSKCMVRVCQACMGVAAGRPMQAGAAMGVCWKPHMARVHAEKEGECLGFENTRVSHLPKHIKSADDCKNFVSESSYCV